MNTGHLSHPLNLLLAGTRSTQREFVGDSVGKQEWRLTHHRQTAAPAINAQLRQWNVVITNIALLQFEMALKLTQQRTIATTGGAT